jgi:DNA-binding transcriptional LysR family regulator
MRASSPCNLDLSAMRALLALRELSNLARVGEKLHLSSSAIFCQIRELERQLGQKLYERDGRTLRLTAAGTQHAESIEKIVVAHDSALAILSGGSEMGQLLRIGCSPHGSVEVMPHLLRYFLRSRTSIETRLVSIDNNSLLNQLRDGALDIVFMTLPDPNATQGFETMHMWRYEMVLVLPPAADGSTEEGTLDELSTTPFILYKRPAIEGALGELRQQLSFPLDVVVESDEPESIREQVRLGIGASLLPWWSVARDASGGRVRVVRLPQPIFLNYGALYRMNTSFRTVFTTLLDTASQWSAWWPYADQISMSLEIAKV